jgi:hypothetical protein
MGEGTPDEHAIVYTPTDSPSQKPPAKAYLVATKELCQEHEKQKVKWFWWNFA